MKNIATENNKFSTQLIGKRIKTKKVRIEQINEVFEELNI
jgi:hypothetical protein